MGTIGIFLSERTIDGAINIGSRNTVIIMACISLLLGIVASYCVLQEIKQTTATIKNHVQQKVAEGD